jgi:CheY-like chemotaxis protein
VRVLVVEDELRMAALLKRGLEEDGYAVDMVCTGTDAVWQANEFSYDSVVLDVILPGLDEVEVCRRLRGAGRWMPILMLTACDTVEDRVRGLAPAGHLRRACGRMEQQGWQVEETAACYRAQYAVGRRGATGILRSVRDNDRSP